MIRWLYKASAKKHSSGTGIEYPVPKKNDFIWLSVVSPKPDEIDNISRDFKVAKKIFENYPRIKRSKRYRFKPLIFGIVDYYLTDKKEVKKVNELFVVGENYIVTISGSPIPQHTIMFNKLKNELKEWKLTPGRVLYEVMDEDSEENYELLEIFEDKIVQLEKEITTHNHKISTLVKSIIELKRTLTIMSRVLWSSSKIVFSIKKGLTPLKLTESEMHLLDDVHDTFVHQIETINVQREMLTDAITISQTFISNKLAELSNKVNMSVKRLTWIMMLLTGVATVLTIPNTVATLFGIPALPLAGKWRLILWALAISTVLPIAWFYFYWKRIIREDQPYEEEMPEVI